MKVRQDAWSHEDDLLLAETVLRHIREGSTQLNAFDEVGDALNRTSAACGFRWNAVVRDKYDEAIKLAKKHRKQRKRQLAQQSKPHVYQPFEPKFEPKIESQLEPKFAAKKEKPFVFTEAFNKELEQLQTEVTYEAEKSMTLDDVISFLKSLQGSGAKANLLEKEKLSISHENEELRGNLKELEEAYTVLQQKHQSMEEDYQSIIQIMDRARRMALIEEESGDRSAAAFKMDKNGNLEKVAK